MSASATIVAHAVASYPNHAASDPYATHLQNVLLDIAVWAGATLPILFMVTYTRYCRWWKSAAGRSIVALDVALLMVFIPGAILRAESNWVFGSWHQWLTVAALLGVSAIILYRTLAILAYAARKRRKGKGASA